VLRQGTLTGMVEPPYSTDALVSMMFGKAVSFGGRISARQGATELKLANVSLEDARLQIRNTTLEVHAGEVIGLAGMEGSGQTLFLECCAGLARPVDGRVGVHETDMTGASYHSFKRHGVAYLPAARLEQGLIPGLTLTEHFVLAEETRGIVIDREKAVELAQQRIQPTTSKARPPAPSRRSRAATSKGHCWRCCARR